MSDATGAAAPVAAETRPPCPRSARRIAELDGWRGISILLVVVGHLIDYRFFDHYYRTPFLIDLAEIWSRMGVHIFFCISGFVITRILVSEESARGTISLGRFYLKRSFKILPPLFAYMLVLWALSAVVAVDGLSYLKTSIFLCNTAILGGCNFFVSHTWSLAIEEQFYLAFPAILMLTRGHRRNAILGVLCVGLIAASAVKAYLHSGIPIDSYAGFACIIAGTLAALNLDRLLPRLSGFRLSWLAIPIFFVVLSLVPHTRIAEALYKIYSPLLITAMLMLSLIDTGAVKSLLNGRTLQFVGMISYSLYIWQQLFIAPLDQYLWTPALIEIPITMVAAAALSYWLIEKPFTTYGRKLAQPLPTS